MPNYLAEIAKCLLKISENLKKIELQIHFGSTVLNFKMETTNVLKILHEEQKNYKCESCGKSYTESGSLKKHIKIIHKGKRNYKCDSCGKSFTQSGSLKNHIKTIHDGKSFTE